MGAIVKRVLDGGEARLDGVGRSQMQPVRGFGQVVEHVSALVHTAALSAEKSWNRLRGLERLAEVVRGVKFADGVRQVRQSQARLQPQQVAA